MGSAFAQRSFEQMEEEKYRPRSSSLESDGWIGLRVDTRTGKAVADSSSVSTAMYPQRNNAQRQNNRSQLQEPLIPLQERAGGGVAARANSYGAI